MFFECNNCLIFCSILYFLNFVLIDEIIVEYQIAKQIFDVLFRNNFDFVKFR